MELICSQNSTEYITKTRSIIHPLKEKFVLSNTSSRDYEICTKPLYQTLTKLRTKQLQFNKMNISLGISTITNKSNTIENKEYHTSSYWEPQFTPQSWSTMFTWSSLFEYTTYHYSNKANIYVFSAHRKQTMYLQMIYIIVVS